jgi:Holliday junction resolvase RusA-like endonuclease
MLTNANIRAVAQHSLVSAKGSAKAVARGNWKVDVLKNLELIVPGIPPSVNHYVQHSRGRHFRTPEALRFQDDLAIMARGRCVGTGKCRFSVEIEISLGPKQKGDIDNFPKIVLDGLVIAGVIHSDSAVDLLTIKKGRTGALESASTKIVVRLLQNGRSDAFSGRVGGA